MSIYELTLDGYYLDESAVPDSSGIYLAFRCIYDDKTNQVHLLELVYIGQSVIGEVSSLKQRIKRHIDTKDLDTCLKPGERIFYAYATCDGRSIDLIENALIFMQQPRLNSQQKKNYHHTMPVGFRLYGDTDGLRETSFKIIRSIFTHLPIVADL